MRLINIFVIVFILVVIGGSFLYVNAVGTVGGYFGGRVLTSYACTCSFNWVVYVGPPRPGVFIYQPGYSRLYSYYNVLGVGQWVLGSYTHGGQCLMYAGEVCVPGAFPQGTMSPTPGVGTSVK